MTAAYRLTQQLLAIVQYSSNESGGLARWMWQHQDDSISSLFFNPGQSPGCSKKWGRKL